MSCHSLKSSHLGDMVIIKGASHMRGSGHVNGSITMLPRPQKERLEGSLSA